MTFRSRCTRALSSLSLASLPTKLTSPRVLQGAVLGLSGILFAGVADASHTRHVAHHRRASRVSAQNTPGTLARSPQSFATAFGATNSVAAVAAGATQADSAARYELRLHHLHTGEDIDVVYRVGNQYIPGAIAKLNYFLRDHRTQDVSHYDPREFDLLHTLLATLGRPGSVIDIVCGYRTPWSNNFLRTRSAVTGVAKNSQHMQAKAIDIRIPGVSTRHLRDVALSLHGGGVGYYPVSQFVHVDVGPVREWSFGGSGE